MSSRVLIAIGGGHATGVDGIAQNLQSSLVKIFDTAVVRIIDLDQILESKREKHYNEQDYDFDSIYNEIIDNETPETKKIDVVIVCGCYALYDTRINKISNLKVFLDSDNDKRLINLINKRHVEGPTELGTLITEYMEHLRPEMQKYIESTRTVADLIIPYESESIGAAIVLDGVSKVIEQMNTGNRQLATPVWNFEGERMDVEKERYNDLS